MARFTRIYRGSILISAAAHIQHAHVGASLHKVQHAENLFY